MSAPLHSLALMLDAPAAPDPRGLGGLLVLVEARERPLPLVEVKVRATIAGDVCRTVVEQRFQNPHAVPLEAVHVFPLPERGAVTEVELRAGEVVVRAECREREQAERTYREAVSRGHRAALLTAEREDVHTLRVANLPPGTEARVRLVIVERLTAQDGRMRWRFPTVVAPRYTPGQPVGHAGPGVSPDTDQSPDASRITPPLRLAGGTTLDLEVHLQGPLRELSSSLHALALSLEDGGARVAPSAKATLNKDFILSWSTGEPSAVASRAWTDGAHTLVVVEPPVGLAAAALPRDAVFVIDISGSMEGGKLAAAKLALKTALHGLNPGDRFRLLAFDDRLEAMSQAFCDYDDLSLARADSWIDGLRARGGTEMLPAIQDALAGEPPSGRLRTVLFVTDGQATNEAQLVAAVAGRRRAARFFTLGIDTAVNASLMERLASAGGGVATLCTPSDDIEAVVARLETRFGSPLLTDLTVDGASLARPEPAALFSGAPVSLLLEGAPASLTLRATGPSGPWSQTLAPRRAELPLGVAWARERVSWLEDQLAREPWKDEALRGEILRVALGAGIASRFTAFVAVDTSVQVGSERVTLVQPVELPEGWSPDFLAAPMRTLSAAPTGGARPSRPPAPLAAAPELDDLYDLYRDDLPFPSASAPPPAPRSAPSLLSRARDAILGEKKKEKVAPARPAAAAPPAPRKEREAIAAPARRELDPAAALASQQSADGSFGGDPKRTAAALLLLVLLGHTRKAGLRQRVVQKAARWLAAQVAPEARLALEVLEAAEAGDPPSPDPRWEPLRRAGPEGALLAARLDDPSQPLPSRVRA